MEEVDLDLQELQRIPVGIRESTLFIETSKTKTLKHVAFMSHYHQLQSAAERSIFGKFLAKVPSYNPQDRRTRKTDARCYKIHTGV